MPKKLGVRVQVIESTTCGIAPVVRIPYGIGWPESLNIPLRERSAAVTAAGAHGVRLGETIQGKASGVTG